MIRTVSKTKVRRHSAQSWSLYFLMAPAILYVLIFSYGPMYGIQIAFKSYQTNLGIWDSTWVGFRYFFRLFQYPDFWKMIRNTLSITLYSLATFPLPVLFALMINELTHLRFKKTVQMISYAPYFLSNVVLCGMVLLFLDRSKGIVNIIRLTMGLEGVSFISQPGAFSSIYVWSGVWQTLGWNTILYIAALSSVSSEMIEAAYIDGATKPQIILHVDLPCIMPTIIIVFIMSTGSILSLGFEKIFLLQNPLNMSASRVLATYVYDIGIMGGQFSYAAAIDLLNMVVNLIVIFVVNQIAKASSGISIC